MRLIAASVFWLSLVACSNPSVTINNNTAATKEKDTANNVKGYAKMTPPANARSMGQMSSPRVGNTTVPITNVDVYVFNANIDDDAQAETLYWALDGDVVYVWGSFDLACIDDAGLETGEVGSAGFVYEADSVGYGWMVATDSCGYSTLFGCSAEGEQPETCGGCDYDADFIVCAAS